MENVKWLITDPMRVDVIKEEGIDLLTILSFNCPGVVGFVDFPLQVL